MDEAKAVRSVWQGLDLPGLIDVHTHFMPKPVMDKVWAYFDSAGPLIGREWPITYRADEDQRIETLRDFGVRAFTSMIYPHKPNMGAWLNSWSADFSARTPECLHTATFYPEESAPKYVAEAIESGAAVFKSHIQVGDYSPIDPLLDDVWGTISDAGVPVVIHCGSGPAPGTHTGPEPIAALLQRFPRLPLIIAHMGMPEYDDFLELADTYGNVHLDTTMAFTAFAEESSPFPVDSRHKLIELGDRILWGSDFPNIPYTYTSALEAVAALGLGDDWVRGVLHHNAARLFGIELPGLAG
nr:amidohydrolase family protein [Nocardia sp. 348MFTsu5.1]